MTRRPWVKDRNRALWLGVALHLGIFLSIEAGWFSFYTLALYGAWVPGEFWDRWRRPFPSSPTAGGEAKGCAEEPGPAPPGRRARSGRRAGDITGLGFGVTRSSRDGE